MLRGLPSSISQERLTDFLKAFGPVNDVRLIRNKETGESRGFAFVDFPSVEEASSFVEYHGGSIEIDDAFVTLDYSRQKDNYLLHEYKDWLCAQCQGNNFARRVACYLCGAPKPLNPIPCVINHEEPRDAPVPVLVVRGLDTQTAEETIYHVFSSLAAVKEVRLIRDKATSLSRGFSFVEFQTVEDATLALHNAGQLRVDGQLVRVSYARSGLEQKGSEGPPKGPATAIANIALEQAQWAIMNSRALSAESELAAHVHPRPHPHAPDPSRLGQAVTPLTHEALLQAGFELEEGTGYYFNRSTGWYYDSRTAYYYDSHTNLYYYYDSHSLSYVPVSTQTAQSAQLSVPTSVTGSLLPPAGQAPDNPPASVSEESRTQPSLGGWSLPSTASASASVSEAPSQSQACPVMAGLPASDAVGADPALRNVVQAPALPNKPTKEKEKKKKPKTLRDKKLSKEMERWNKKTRELQQEDDIQDKQESKIKFALTTTSLDKRPPLLPTTATLNTPTEQTEHGRGGGEVESQTISASEKTSQEEACSLGNVPYKEQLPLSIDLSTICLLCRRKFRDFSALERHIEISQLHKLNLEAAREAEVQQMREVTKQQIRKKEQQKLKKKKKKKLGTSVLASGSGSSGQALDEHNIGNQMLKRMGWKAGEGLGKDASGIIAPIEVVMRAERAGLGSEDSLALVTSEPGDTYQQAAKKRARARLETMMHAKRSEGS
jgi:RNA-binding protein 5/10